MSTLHSSAESGHTSPTISVVIPTHRRRREVGRAIDSAIRQTLRPLEIIVVDDGSHDGTVEELEALELPVPLVVLEHEHNRGGSAARNSGIAAARGQWIAFLDSDDEWVPEKLERQFAVLRHAGPTYGAAYSGSITVDAAGRVVTQFHPTSEGDVLHALHGSNVVGTTSSVVVRRDLLHRVGGFDESLRSCQDWDLWVRLAAVTRFACVPEALVRYTSADSGRITSHFASRRSGHLAMYRKHLRGPLRTNRQARAQYLFLLGEVMLAGGRSDWAKRLLGWSLQLDPLHPRRAAYWGLSLLRLDSGTYRRTSVVLARALRRVKTARAEIRNHLRRSPASSRFG